MHLCDDQTTDCKNPSCYLHFLSDGLVKIVDLLCSRIEMVMGFLFDRSMGLMIFDLFALKCIFKCDEIVLCLIEVVLIFFSWKVFI